MTTTKRSYSFRISKQAEQHLNKIVNVTGMNKTAAVELSIAKLSQSLKGEEMSNTKNVANRYGKSLDFVAAANLMDDDLREQLHDELAPCSNQEFFDAYVNAHSQMFGEDWVLDDPNPAW